MNGNAPFGFFFSRSASASSVDRNLKSFQFEQGKWQLILNDKLFFLLWFLYTNVIAISLVALDVFPTLIDVAYPAAFHATWTSGARDIPTQGFAIFCACLGIPCIKNFWSYMSMDSSI